MMGIVVTNAIYCCDTSCLGTSHAYLSCSVGDVITQPAQSLHCWLLSQCMTFPRKEALGILPKNQSIPADILVPNWSLSCPKVINPLNLQFVHKSDSNLWSCSRDGKRRPNTLEMMRRVPLEDGHASHWL